MAEAVVKKYKHFSILTAPEPIQLADIKLLHTVGSV